MTKWVYSFGGGASEGSAAMRDLLGGKGANLAEMAALGLPVPPGFTITTEVCAHFYAKGRGFPADLEAQVEAALAEIGRVAGHAFNDPNWPLLVSVRSGARASMPGMMDTVLNLGLNDETVEALANYSGDARFAWDCYRRFVEMYSSVVLGVEHHIFEDALEELKESKGLTLDTQLTADDWRAVVKQFKAIIEANAGVAFPQDPRAQLWGAIKAVFSSWMNHRAIVYRHLHNIPENWGTAVNVQAMVFGNLDANSATGVAFTRNPSTGVKELYGEYLLNAQGEDVVAGLRTPQPLTEVASRASPGEKISLEATMPKVFAEFVQVADRLERHYRDMQDMEFTIERGKLWMLQTRSGKRTARAALKLAVDMAKEGLITREEALLRVEPTSLDQLLHPTIDPAARRDILATGLPASPGAAFGEIVFNPEEAAALAASGRKVILVRTETSPEDIHGMHAAEGILTARGGMTSHAAVVARGMGKPCVTGVGALRIDYEEQCFTIVGKRFVKGDKLTIDGSAGHVIAGEVKMQRPELTGEFAVLMGWADQVRRLKVRANAETPSDARAARRFGAEGIGLARTEHMFFEGERIVAVREMILADDAEGRRAALAKLLPIQREDFKHLFEIMAGLPVTIRLLDPPLHEFLPHTDSELAQVARAMGADPVKLRRRALQLSEFNPMLGFRGVRLAVVFPEIVDMQARAIFEAAIEASLSTGAPAQIEIMAPLVFSRAELDLVNARVDAMAKLVEDETGLRPRYHIGTMIELPRAALRAGEIAPSADFFSFGTNDLTQTTLGISRDDSGSFLGAYIEKGVLPHDPFVSIDQEGVGELVALGCQRARASRPDIALGVCGEHGGDPASVAFFEKIGIDYVSCSPFRVPIARLAAAQAALGKTAEGTA
ncbi:pyruvate, phosphate dikinase [Methylocystis sp. MJC1]|uniref:pyruvate, phosphate dikinase n=1 Tax=Methylocystis sp. MJC1 TaxID=2654282 RepID=UPI0013ECBE11|nr:pyruvate, phosphate dikinase [Methylocystis sp. MJC1]KAF2992536.1 Pyruvate, phosphate dikinase [Methylocystis sp. MJC1]MBU6526508.1 pyruvate, phosphate dikinase [Methylocystis sp. MJC1]UZX12949.1 pyruvate, phosphate dikinase [Methylocystis sp. MJC1]